LDGKVLDHILSEFVRLDYHVSVKIPFAAHYGVPQERWRLILPGSTLSEIAPPEPTHYAAGAESPEAPGVPRSCGPAQCPVALALISI
jgi:site-specific DNA-cytosine methylase